MFDYNYELILLYYGILKKNRTVVEINSNQNYTKYSIYLSSPQNTKYNAWGPIVLSTH